MFIFTNEKVVCKDKVISGPPHYAQLANLGRLMSDVMSDQYVKNVPEGIGTVDVHLLRTTETRSAKNWEIPTYYTARCFTLLRSTKQLYR